LPRGETDAIADDPPGGAAQFLAITRAMTAGAIATFCMCGANSGRIAASGSAFARRARRAGADAAGQCLNSRAFYRRWSGVRTPRCLRVPFQKHTPRQGGPAETQEALQYRSATLALGQRSDQRIETAIVHAQVLPNGLAGGNRRSRSCTGIRKINFGAVTLAAE
jgi:hypothetical protein